MRSHSIKLSWNSDPFSSVQSLSHIRLFVTPWITARQASLSITNSRSSLRLTSIESVMPSSHLILYRPLLLLPLIPPSIRVFSNESTFCMRWPSESGEWKSWLKAQHSANEDHGIWLFNACNCQTFIKITCSLSLPSQIFFSYFLNTVLYENMIIVSLKMNWGRLVRWLSQGKP